MTATRSDQRRHSPPQQGEPPDEATTQPTSEQHHLQPLQRLVGECLGTFLLVLFHAGVATSLGLFARRSHLPQTAADLVFLALADGFSLFVIILIIGKISGVMVNPAVTLGLASAGRFPWKKVAPYLGAQSVGAVLGALGVLAIFGHAGVSLGHLGTVALSSGTSTLQGAAVEALGAFVLVLTIMSVAEDPRAPSGWAALAIGFALAADVLLIQPATGAAVNPARAFGPDFVGAFFGVAVDWGNYLVAYLIGPIVGAVVAANVYRVIASAPRGKPAPEPSDARR